MKKSFVFEVITVQGKVLRAKRVDVKHGGTLSLDKLEHGPAEIVYEADGVTPVILPRSGKHLMDFPPYLGLKSGDTFTLDITKD